MKTDEQINKERQDLERRIYKLVEVFTRENPDVKIEIKVDNFVMQESFMCSKERFHFKVLLGV